MKAHWLLGLAAFVAACSSSDATGTTNTPSGSDAGGGSGADSGSGGGGTDAGGGGGDDAGGDSPSCTLTFGGDASSVTASSCSLLGPNVSDSTDFTFSGSVDGLDSSLFTFSVKYPNGITAKTYETKDLFYVSASVSVTATGKIYDVDFDSEDATKTRDGSVTTVFSSPEHGTIDVTYDSDDTPASHATVKITF